MKNINYYLDEFKKIESIESDNELSKRIGVNRQQIYKVRKGKGWSIGMKKFVEIAKKLKINEMEIIATIKAEKEKDEEIKKIWIRLAEEKSNK